MSNQQNDPQNSPASDPEPHSAEPNLSARDRATAAKKGQESLSINEMLRVLDVARQVREERETAEVALQRDELRRDIKRKLADSAKVTGEDVTEAEIDAAIDQYFDNLHKFKRPPMGLHTLMAHLYVLRRRVAAAIGVGVILLGSMWYLFLSPWAPLSSSVRAARAAEARIEAAEALHSQIDAVASAPSAKQTSAALLGAIQADDADATAAQQSLGKMKALLTELRSAYEVRIVSGSDQESGFELDYTDDSGTRSAGFFVVVQAFDSQGNVIPRRIRSSETGETSEVTRWAERVPRDVFERLVADKSSDAILDETAFSVKRIGEVSEETLLLSNGQPVARAAQLTQWPSESDR